MNYNITPIFATPLYSSELEIQTENELEIVKNLEFRDPDDFGVNISNTINLLDMPEMKNLKQQVDDNVEIYVREFLSVNVKQKFEMVRSWGILVKPEARTSRHTHANSVISGVLYLDLPEGSGYINFFRKNSIFTETFEFLYDGYNQYNSGSWKFAPKKGILILFPSNLEHEVDVNKSNEDRYSIAFDYWVHGTIGNPATGTVLEL